MTDRRIKSRIGIAVVAAGVAACVLTAVLLSPKASGVTGASPSPLPTSGPTNGPMPGAPTTSPAAAGTPAVSAPTPIRPTAASMVKAWKSGSGGKALTVLTAQAASVQMAGATGQYPEMLRACTALAGAVKGAQAAPGIADAGMQAEYAKALTALRKSAAECTSAITQTRDGIEDTVTHVNTAGLALATADLDTGLTELYIATETLRQ